MANTVGEMWEEVRQAEALKEHEAFAGFRPEFEQWALANNCYMKLCKYRQNYRTYDSDRTQYLWEGWLAAKKNNKSS